MAAQLRNRDTKLGNTCSDEENSDSLVFDTPELDIRIVQRTQSSHGTMMR